MKKTVIITGASSGIGEFTAYRLASEGHNVALLARRVDKLEAIATKIKKDGGEASVFECDVTDYEQIKSATAAVKAKYGRIDVLVNNAGLMPLSYLDKGRRDEAKRMVDVNVIGLIDFTYAVLPTFIEQNSGHFINISSVSGKVIFPSSAVYCATKFAVRAFSDGLRQEMAQKYDVRVTDIQPGAVETELKEHIKDQDVFDKAFSKFGQFDALEPDDIARAISFAISCPNNMGVNEITIRPQGQPN